MRRQSRSLNKLKSHKCFQPRVIEFGQMVWEKVEPDVNNDNDRCWTNLNKKNSSGNLILVKSDTCTERAWAILVINLQWDSQSNTLSRYKKYLNTHNMNFAWRSWDIGFHSWHCLQWYNLFPDAYASWSTHLTRLVWYYMASFHFALIFLSLEEHHL